MLRINQLVLPYVRVSCAKEAVACSLLIDLDILRSLDTVNVALQFIVVIS